MKDNKLNDLIKTPDGLDNSVLKGIERGRKYKKAKKNKGMKKFLVAAGLTVAITGGIGVINPEFASALSDIKNVIGDFNREIFGRDKEKFEELATVVGTTQVDKGVSITLNEVMFDDNNFMMTLMITGEMFKNYDGNNQIDFVQFESDAFINDGHINISKSKVEIVNDTTARVIVNGDILGMEIPDSANVKFDITSVGRGDKMESGKWNFDFNVNKKASKKINPDIVVDTEDGKLWIDEVTVTDLSTTIQLKGKTDPKNHKLMSTKFRVKDDTGKIIDSETIQATMYKETGDAEMKMVINEDLTDVKNIEVTNIVGGKEISKEIDGFPYTLIQFNGNGEFKEDIISREVTKEEIADGYGLPSVIHYVNMSKDFKSLDDIIGDTIQVSDKQTVEVLNIEDTKLGTKITFKTDGYYDKNNLHSLSVFDSEMTDVIRAEDRLNIGSVEDGENYIYSVTINKLDNSKKYTIGLPRVEKMEEATFSMKVDLQ